MVLPRRYAISTVPLLGRGDAQTIINRQIVDSADIVFAVFNHRLGTVTPRAVSGTAEEMARAVSAGKLVHVYFGEKKLPYDADLEQFRALREFRTDVEKLGLVATFRTEGSLRDEIFKALDYDVPELLGRPKLS
jgi:hypothetical protein